MPSVTRFPFKRALGELREEYELLTGDSCPPKQSILLKGDTAGSWRGPCRYVNVMGGLLSDGTFGSKTVFVDEDRGRMAGDVLHYKPNGELIYSLPSKLVTPLRCGMMVALALSYRTLKHERDVLIVGSGEIGVATASVLWALRGELNIGSLSVKTGRRATLNRDRLPVGVDQTPNINRADDSTTLITATSHNGPPLETEDLIAVPEETVSLDSGLLLGKSWRQHAFSFCDHTLQMSKVLDAEFPHDGDTLNDPFLFQRRTQPLDKLAELLPGMCSATYLYGIAIADLVIGRLIHEHLEETKRLNTFADRMLYA